MCFFPSKNIYNFQVHILNFLTNHHNVVHFVKQNMCVGLWKMFWEKCLTNFTYLIKTMSECFCIHIISCHNVFVSVYPITQNTLVFNSTQHNTTFSVLSSRSFLSTLLAFSWVGAAAGMMLRNKVYPTNLLGLDGVERANENLGQQRGEFATK